MIELDGEFFNLKVIGRIQPIKGIWRIVIFDTNLNIIKSIECGDKEQFNIQIINIKDAIYGERQKSEVF